MCRNVFDKTFLKHKITAMIHLKLSPQITEKGKRTWPFSFQPKATYVSYFNTTVWPMRKFALFS